MGGSGRILPMSLSSYARLSGNEDKVVGGIRNIEQSSLILPSSLKSYLVTFHCYAPSGATISYGNYCRQSIDALTLSISDMWTSDSTHCVAGFSASDFPC